MQKLTVKENILTPEQFTVLFKAVGWGNPPSEQIEIALKNSICTFSLYDNEEFIGMGRLVGENSMEKKFFTRSAGLYFYLMKIMVLEFIKILSVNKK